MAAGAIAAAAAAAAIVKRKNEDLEAITRARSTWAAFAAERGLDIKEDADARPSIVGRVNGVDCVVSLVLDQYGFAHTRVLAAALSPRAVTLRVFPNPTGSFAFLKTLLQQDIEVGDPAFDEAFIVQCEPEEVAASLVGPTLRAAIHALTAWKMTGFAYAAGRAELHFPLVEPDVDAIAVALEAVSEAARWSPPSDVPFR